MAYRVLQRFTALLWCTFIALSACAVSFALYAKSESELRAAYELRVHSLLLAAELRQSSDDLTRMMRTYVVTGDRTYGKHFQEILDIRDGRAPLPIDYENVYWDLVLDGRRPTAMGPPTSLLERMHAAGFTEVELGKLAEAKTQSDALVNIERTAMRFVEALESQPPSETSDAKRMPAVLMLHDDIYHRAKADIMKPIGDFHRMVGARTAGLVAAAERQSGLTLATFIVAAALLVLMLWLLRESFRRMIGGTVSQLHEVVTQSVSRELRAPTLSDPAAKDSILGKLAMLHESRAADAGMRRDSERALSAAEQRFRDVATGSSDCICIVQDAMVRFVNPKLATICGYAANEMIGHPFIELVHADDRAALLERYRNRLEGRLEGVKSIFRVREKSEAVRTVESHVAKLEWGSRPATIYFMNEVVGSPISPRE